MADEEGEEEYMSENVQEIVKHAMDHTLQNAIYSKDKVNTWCNQLLDSCLKELAKLDKPFKYIVTCVIMQKNGAPLSTAATCWWDLKTDGLTCVQVEKETLDCIVTVYGCKI